MHHLDSGTQAETSASGAKRALDATGPPAKKADRSKRLRVSRACDQCRAGREKCDGAQPTCQTCEAQLRVCSYNEQPKKRGIQPNYIRTLELTLAWLLQTVPERGQQLAKLLPNPHSEAHQVIAFKDVSASDALHTVWRNGIICRQIDQLLSGVDIEEPRDVQAESSDLAARRLDGSGSRYQSPPLSAPSDTCDLHQEAQEPVSIGENCAASRSLFLSNFTDAQIPHKTLKLPSNAWSLLEHYFAFTQTWLPITEKHDILRLMYAYPSEGLPFTEALSSEHAELWSIMACSASQIHKYEPGADVEYCGNVARGLINPQQGFQLGHVKALLILSLIDLARESWIHAWLTIGSAVRSLTYILASQPNDTLQSPDRRKHTVLACFLLENAAASRIEASSHLRAEDVTKLGLLVEDGLEEWSPWHDPDPKSRTPSTKAPARTISTFNELIRSALDGQGQLGNRSQMDVVFALIQNASDSAGRRHPSVVLAERRPAATPVADGLGGGHVEHVSPQVTHHARQHSLNHGFWNLRPAGVQGQPRGQQYPFMSIPHGGSGPLTGSTSTQATVSAPTPGLWHEEASEPGLQEPFNMNPNRPTAYAPEADIFEELAMLDRTESASHPKFMQNLGFGPDLDLAEFFGADYQPSDPLLAYMQPSSFGDALQGHHISDKG